MQFQFSRSKAEDLAKRKKTPWHRREQVVTNLSTWLQTNNATLKAPSTIYYKRTKVGRLEHVRNDLVFIPTLNADELAAHQAKHPIPEKLWKEFGL